MSEWKLRAPLTVAMTATFGASGSVSAPGNPLADTLDIIATAHAAGQMWVRLDNGTDTFTAAWPAVGYRDTNAAYPAIIYAWAGFAWDDTNSRIILYGGGHANSAANEVFTWSAATRGWQLAFYGSEHLDMDAGSTNTFRVKGYNDAPVSAHTYCNNIWLPVSGRFFTFGGAAWNDGSVLRVWDEEVEGFQSPLRIACGFSLDMTEAGTGKTGGGTGTNAGTSLTGANAWLLHDWLNPSHPTPPVFGGTTYAVHINRGAVAVEEGGKDVIYYTAGSNYSLLRAELHATDPMQDVLTRVFNDINLGPEDPVSGGNIAFDPVDEVFVSLTAGAGSYESFRFVDMKRASPAWRRPTTPTGDSALKAENKGEPGLLWDPIDGCYVGATRGSGADPGVFPGSVWQIFKPAPSGGETPDSGWSIVKRDAPGTDDLPPIGPFSGESFPTVTGKWRWANSLRCGLFLTDPINGQVWAYIPENWTDPRA